MKVIPSSPVAHFPRFFKLDGVIQHVEGEHHQLYLYSLTLLLSQSKSIANGALAVHL